MKLRLLSALSFLFTSAIAQNPLNLLSTTKGGSCYEVCYYNNYLYAGCANSLIVSPTNGPNHSPGTASDTIRFISNIDYLVVRKVFYTSAPTTMVYGSMMFQILPGQVMWRITPRPV